MLLSLVYSEALRPTTILINTILSSSYDSPGASLASPPSDKTVVQPNNYALFSLPVIMLLTTVFATTRTTQSLATCRLQDCSNK